MSPTPTTEAPRLTMLGEVFAQASGGEALAPLNPDQIDTCIAEYEFALRASSAADAVLRTAKQGLTLLVQQQGSVPAHAEQSLRIVGRRNQATITTANTIEVDEDAVGDLKQYLIHQGLHSELFGRLFGINTKHTLVKGAKEVLAGFKLQLREHERISSLFGLCIHPKPKAPSLKVELIEPAKPARTPRAKKAVA